MDKIQSEADLRFKAELEWLLGEGLVVPFDETEFCENFFQSAAEHFPNVIPDVFNYASEMSSFQIGTLRLARWFGPDAVLFSARTPGFLRHAFYPTTRSTVRTDILSLVLTAFPEPDDTTPWEQIIEFRSDPDTPNRVLALKRWMSKVARQNLTPPEINQEIEWLVHEYQAHMRLHKMKIAVGALETILTACRRGDRERGKAQIR
jgi:hypothetical protein